MTLGIDVSRLFNDMVLCVETKDLVVKKMVYLYLTTYAQEHPEMALMCINSLNRDCNDSDPMVYKFVFVCCVCARVLYECRCVMM